MHYLILLLLVLPITLGAQPLSCSPPTLQALCSAQELNPSTSSNSFSLPLLAFNPIHLRDGNKHLKEVDYAPHPAAPDLELVRYYDSMAIHYSAFGNHWLLSYDIRLIEGIEAVQIVLPNGTHLNLDPALGHLSQIGHQRIWHNNDNEKWYFDRLGWLQRIQRPHRPPLHIYRHTQGPLLHRIHFIEQNQHRLTFKYDSSVPALIQQVQTPVGVIHYDYEPLPDSTLHQLYQIRFPDQRRLYYHHEAQYQGNNVGLITGKSIQLHPHAPRQRVRSWIYNAHKQAHFMMAETPSQWVRLHFPNPAHPNQTHIDSPQGRTTVFFSSNPSSEIERVTGASCWACPPTLIQHPQYVQLAHARFDRQLRWWEGNPLGWPQLRLEYDAQHRLTAWSSATLGTTRLNYDGRGRAQQMHYPNGDRQQVHYSTTGEVQRIDYYSGHAAVQTQIQRPHPHYLHLKHPNENETLRYLDSGQIKRRYIERFFYPPHSAQPHRWHYEDLFDYDTDQRLRKHDLPEGGALLYEWKGAQLQRMVWENKQGQRQLIAQAVTGGLAYGNGLLRLEVSTPYFHWLAHMQPDSIWWQQLLIKGHNGLITTQRIHAPSHAASELSHRTFSYNAQHQLERDATTALQWHADGSLSSASDHSLPQIQRDVSGLATHYKDDERHYILRYSPMRRLDVVLDADKTVQKNSHNSAGFRIYTQHYPQELQQFFLYHEKKLVAEFTAPFEAKLPIHAAHPVSRRYVYWHDQPVALIDYEHNPAGELLVMHSDHLGAVHTISDQKQQLRWAARYDAFGRVQSTQGDLTLHLRRAGQYHDMATGWHDNGVRTYLPQQGHYLEPDPLGPSPYSQLYGYANQQPLNHTDPWGLVLFAFDGTRYDERSGGVIHQLHLQTTEPSFYVGGPGQADELTWDAMVAYSADHIVQQQWQNLLNYLRSAPPSTTPIPIDIIGFSRGAALSRHFANQIIQHSQNGFFSYTDTYGIQVQACIQPRFMGLLDSVAQLGILGSRNHLYQFSVSPIWQWVGHAVALHEYRSLFPALLMGSGGNKHEIGLVGAHGDLGGGYPSSSPDIPPLSQISLQWLLWQAQAQGLSFISPPSAKSAYAYMHDESRLLSQDRAVENHDFTFTPDLGVSYSQDYHPTLGRLVRQEVNAFLSYELSPTERQHNQSAKVDLQAYYRWLDQTLNWSPD